MKQGIAGIHHITGISGPAQENVDFYAGVIGLRLVKRTVNFDDPGTYHLYYGNYEGQPGSIMTFFPWANARRGRPGAGMVGMTSFSVPAQSLDYWFDRLETVSPVQPTRNAAFEKDSIEFADPDGLRLAVVGEDHTAAPPVPESGVQDVAIRGFHGATLLVAQPDATARLLTEIFGYRFVSQDGDRLRFVSGQDAMGNYLDLEKRSDSARPGSGTIHHIAFRARDETEQLEWREAIASSGLFVTEVKDRNYFKSIYFREPNGVLFEIATDPPGFGADEPIDHLGEQLKLPPWLESRRSAIEEQLVDLRLPSVSENASTG